MIKLENYPTLDSLNLPENELIDRTNKALSQFGFFYVKDLIEARTNIEEQLANLQNSVDVYYGEDAYTGKGSVFHGTYSMLAEQKESIFKQQNQKYFEFLSKLLGLVSMAFGYPRPFLEEVSQRHNCRFYIYDRETDYMNYIAKANAAEISIGPHKDRSLITIVVSIQGFEGYHPDYDWFSIPDRDGYLMVQAGTLLESVTQGAIKANVHRVRGYDSSKSLFWGHLVPVKNQHFLHWPH